LTTLLTQEFDMALGAQNQLTGTVVKIKKGDIMGQVEVKLDGGDKRMSSVMTVDSIDELKLKDGDKVTVVVKAVNVMVAKA
jgi:molybdopterin-binding protein